MIINSDGTLYHITEKKTYKLIFTVLDNGNLVAYNDDNNIIIINFEAHKSYIPWKSIMKLTYKGKSFTRNGYSYEHEVKEDEKLRKRDRDYKEIKKIFNTDKKGSWGTVISLSIPCLLLITSLILGFFEGSISDKQSILYGCIILITFIIVVRNIWLITLRKKKDEVIRILDKSYGKLPVSELVNYIRACLQNPNLKINDWKSRNAK